jgi:hypothetical protein
VEAAALGEQGSLLRGADGLRCCWQHDVHRSFLQLALRLGDRGWQGLWRLSLRLLPLLLVRGQVVVRAERLACGRPDRLLRVAQLTVHVAVHVVVVVVVKDVVGVVAVAAATTVADTARAGQ